MLRNVLTVCASTTLFAISGMQITMAADAASAGDDALAEITVTATKQTQNLQKVEAAVTVVTAGTLIDQGVSDLTGAQKLVPSVRFQPEQNNTQVIVRGIGST